MMFEEGSNAKSGVFSHLFDWNRKSRKKLFANGGASSEGKKLAGGSNNNVQGSSFWMDGHDDGKDPRGTASVKKSSEYSRVSSVADEEILSSGTKAPGVVARLMGLDTLPTSEMPVTNSSPSPVPRYMMEGGQDQERAHALDVGAHHITLSRESDPYPRKQEELKYRKMTSSAAEKFGLEVLPPQLTRPSPASQYKLLSPMRNPRFISPENAADIMEAAARMYELGLKGDSSLMASMKGSFSFPTEMNEIQEGRMDSPSSSSHQETLLKSSPSNARKKPGDGHLNRSWNVSESGATSSGQKKLISKGGKSREKSNSTGALANANVQIKMNPNIRKGSLGVVQRDEIKIIRPVRNQSHVQQTQVEKRVPAPCTSGVPKPHKQKRSSMVDRGKLPTLPSSSSQQLTNDVKSDARFMRNKSSNIIRVSSKHEAGKGNSYLGKEPASKRGIGNPRNRSLRDANVRKSELLGNNFMLRKDKSIRSNIIIGERLNLKQDKDMRKSGTDVVSFTFTSPVTRVVPPQSLSNKATGKLDRSTRSSLEASRSASNAKNKALPIVRVNVISDDSGNNSSDHDVHKLAFGLEPTRFPKTQVSSEASPGDSLAASTSFSADVAEDGTSSPCVEQTDHIGSFPSFATPSLQSNVQKPIAEVQGGEDFKDRDINNVPESDQRLPSPFSTLEACFSSESCESSESCSSITGQDQDADSSRLKEFQTVEEEREESREPSSILEKNLCGVNTEIISGRDRCTVAADEEMDYVRDILSIAMLHSNESSLASTKLVLDPDLYHQLEIKKSWSEASDDGESSLKRKLLFDCVNECLDLRYRHHPVMGLELWINGMDGCVLRKDQAAEEVCREIMFWRSMETWMVDELVDRDFCRHLGRCVNLKADSFQVGVEIQELILTTLIDETVAEFSVQESGKVAPDITCWNLYQGDFQDYCLYCV